MPNSTGVPSKDSVQFFEKVISGHNAVESLESRATNVYVVHRKKRPPVIVFLTDVYTVGIADVIDAQQRVLDLNAVVTISNWNGYTRAAKEYGMENEVGVFMLGEFMGALHKDNSYEYVKLDEEGQPIYHYRG
jgi:hypothetical protein